MKTNKLFKDDERNEIVNRLQEDEKYITCFLNKKGECRYVFKESVNSYQLIGMLDSVKHSLLSRMREQIKPEYRD